MGQLTVFEFDALVPPGGAADAAATHEVPLPVFEWLQSRCQAAHDEGHSGWVRLSHRRGRPAVQVTSHVGVLRAPCGFQIEVLPKVGKAIGGGAVEARQLLLDMLGCLPGFRHVRQRSASLAAKRMPLLEVFVSEFLRAVETVVKRGVRGDYALRRGNLFAFRGKLMVAAQLRHNLCRADRFFTEHDEFSTDRPENRLLRAALAEVMVRTTAQENQRLACELDFAMADIPASSEPSVDFARVRLDRGMSAYDEALAWARLILSNRSPLSGSGKHDAPSLLFPMEAVFEAFVAQHLARQLAHSFALKTQERSEYLVRHRDKDWFCLKPDFVVRQGERVTLVLDTKWKLLDSLQASSQEKYGLSQGDFYQLQAYGHSYLGGQGEVVLVYPRTSTFDAPLPVFEFPKSRGLRLWVVPFCLSQRRLVLRDAGALTTAFA